MSCANSRRVKKAWYLFVGIVGRFGYTRLIIYGDWSELSMKPELEEYVCGRVVE